MADKFEKMVRCLDCKGFFPYFDSQLCPEDKIAILSDCKKHVPDGTWQSQKPIKKNRLTPKRSFS